MLCTFILTLFAVTNAQHVLYSAPTEYWNDWKAVDLAPKSAQVSFTIAVKEQNLDIIREVALDVSDPYSERYGQFLSQQQINDLTKPTQDDLTNVMTWLESSNVQFTQRHSMISVTCTVSEAESLLSTQFHVLASQEQGQKVIRADDFLISASVELAISTIFGLHGIPIPSVEPVASGALPAKVTPAVLASTYNISGVTVDRSTKVRQAVAEFQGQLMSQKDLSTFFTQFVPDAQGGDEQVFKYVGNPVEPGGGVEALLDIQYIMGVAVGVKTEFWEWKEMDFCHDLNGWTTEILTTDVPLVHSVSYGWQGPLSQLGCKQSDISVVENNLAKIAAKGITILLASGDSGSGFSGGLLTGHMYPSWPASSPWVTAVGSTRFVDQTVGDAEMATDQFGSGGGFSADFSQSPNATWQTDVVKAYLASGVTLPSSRFFDASGRATPDISALGEGYQVIVSGHAESVGGTSASTPAFAGMVSLLNDARAQAGKGPMGFLNPFLYKNADAFTDITLGNNKIGRGGEKLLEGFECAKGWDPVTGLGTPKFDKLLQAALALP